MGLIGIANPVIGETLAFVIAYQLKRTVWPFVKNTVYRYNFKFLL